MTQHTQTFPHGFRPSPEHDPSLAWSFSTTSVYDAVRSKDAKGQGGNKSRAEVGTPSSRALNWHSNKPGDAWQQRSLSTGTRGSSEGPSWGRSQPRLSHLYLQSPLCAEAATQARSLCRKRLDSCYQRGKQCLGATLCKATCCTFTSEGLSSLLRKRKVSKKCSLLLSVNGGSWRGGETQDGQ